MTPLLAALILQASPPSMADQLRVAAFEICPAVQFGELSLSTPLPTELVELGMISDGKSGPGERFLLPVQSGQGELSLFAIPDVVTDEFACGISVRDGPPEVLSDFEADLAGATADWIRYDLGHRTDWFSTDYRTLLSVFSMEFVDQPGSGEVVVRPPFETPEELTVRLGRPPR